MSEHVINQVLFLKNPSVERLSQKRGRCVDSLSEGEYQSRSQEEVAPLPVQVLLGQARVHFCRQPRLPPEVSPSESQLPFPDLHALVSFPDLLLSARALLLLAVKTETFYSVYKPEVTQLNETICHIKFTSARIKRQIT